MKALFLIIIALSFLSQPTFSQDSTKNYTLEIGIRCKKFTGFYWENGITGEFSSPKILKGKVSFGLNLVSSRLGSAISSNALPTLETELSILKYFRTNKAFQPLVQLNIGYAHANYGPLFASIPNNGALLSLEAGVSFSLPVLKKHIKLKATGGYNFLNGNGSRGMGTVYPFYGQFSILYGIK